MDLQEKTAGIVQLCLGETDTNPYAIFHHIAATDYVSIHGPEHRPEQPVHPRKVPLLQALSAAGRARRP